MIFVIVIYSFRQKKILTKFSPSLDSSLNRIQCIYNTMYKLITSSYSIDNDHLYILNESLTRFEKPLFSKLYKLW